MAPSTSLPFADLVHVVTTTIYSPAPSSTLATSSASSGSSSDSFPLASVIGGSLAGVLLAIIAVTSWKIWGRSIERQEALKRKEELSIYTTLENTRKNAVLSARKYMPTYSFPQERKIKFVSSSEKLAPSSPNKLRHASLTTERSPPPATPDPLYETILTPPSPEGTPLPPSLQEPAPSLQLPLSHKASNASSLSIYSFESGEEHQTRAPMAAVPRKFDPRRLTHFSRNSRTQSQYSTLGDIDELEQSHEMGGNGV